MPWTAKSERARRRLVLTDRFDFDTDVKNQNKFKRWLKTTTPTYIGVFKLAALI
ncbi:hypothetical protein HMPREF9554_00936 [Treponema phagedenis F0421]|nr:hypothetical protein HMPREF9554_00936 [Treponema phagedenis F0421]